MSRHFGEAFQASQCNRMCDVCELTSAAADSAPGSAAAAAGAAGSSPRPAFISRDLTEAAIQLCDFVATNGGGAAGDAGGKGKGKRKRSSIAGANITQKQLVDELRKKNSSVSGGGSHERTAVVASALHASVCVSDTPLSFRFVLRLFRSLFPRACRATTASV